jgi:hypothetical protein
MPFGEIASNWAIRSLKERALTRHSRAFGRQRRIIGPNWPRRELCDSHSTWSITSGLAILAKPLARVQGRRISLLKPKTLYDEEFDSLERMGLLEKNGKFRMARNGQIQPVWVITQLSKWLVESGQMDNYLATWETDLKSS